MLGRALKHYILVGAIFPFAGGWLLTAVVNTAIGLTLESMGVLEGDPYWWALLSTCSSLAIIASMSFLGNRLYRRGFGPASLSQWSLLVSTILFMSTLYPWIAPPLLDTLNMLEGHVQYAVRNTGEVVKMLSLPLLRWAVLPVSYVLAARILLPKTAADAVTSSENDSRGA